jgi:hypothetical protein
VIDPSTGELVVDPETQTPVKDPSDIESAADVVRKRVAPQSVLGQIKTPDSIIADLEAVKVAAAHNVLIVREADRTRRAAKRIHARARLKALKNAQGTVDDRKAEADVVAMAEWEIADNAEVAYEYARSVAQLVRDRTSAIQTQAKQVELTYQLAGKGRA